MLCWNEDECGINVHTPYYVYMVDDNILCTDEYKKVDIHYSIVVVCSVAT